MRLSKLMDAFETINKLNVSEKSTSDITALYNDSYAAMNDDFNTPVLIAYLFEGVRIINSVNAGTETITEKDLAMLKKLFNEMILDVLGLKQEEKGGGNELLDKVMNFVLTMRAEAKGNKDFGTSDKIRNGLEKININIKDTKDGSTWSVKD